MNGIPAKRRKSGFTLIELLVVIAIIAAILFPVFARARENARRASCQSNEKNIALGFKQYIQDNGEKYPPAIASAEELKASGSSGGLSEYIKSAAIFYCPSDSNKTIGSYGYLLTGQNESAIPDTATTALLKETSATRHFAGQNIAFVDGHVKWGKGTGEYGSPATAGAVDPNDVDAAITASLIWEKSGVGDVFFPLAGCRNSATPCELDAPSTKLDFSITNGTSTDRYLALNMSSTAGTMGMDKTVVAGTTKRFGDTNGWTYQTFQNSFTAVLTDPTAGKTRNYYIKIKGT